MEKNSSDENTIRPIHLVLIVWLISAVWNVFHWYLYYQHYKIDIETSRLALLGILDWLFWLVALPVVVLLAKKYPPVRLKSLIFLHLPMNLITTVFTVLASVTMRSWLEPGDSVDIFLNARNRLISEGSWYFLFYWFVVGAYFTVDYHAAYSRSQKESLEFQLENENLNRRLTDSRLQMLRAQLQPHFLFNSLHSISSLMDVSIDKARTVLIQLADLLRDALEISKKDLHTLKQEYAWLQRYLSLESVRFKDQLQWKCDLGDSTESALVPCLLLQPLLENTFKHARKKSDGLLKIEISAQRSNEQLVIELKDNGSGFPEGGESINDGNGLSYVRDIIQTHFGDAAEMHCFNNVDGGATVSIRLPYKEATDNEN